MNLLRSLARYARCLVVTVAQGGPASTAYWAAFAFLRPNRFAIFARDLQAALPLPANGQDERFDLWTADRLREWRRDRRGLPTEFYQDRIDGVGLCAVACTAGEVGGLIWIYRPGDYSRMFRLQAGEAELNHGYVRPEHRERGLFVRLLAFTWRRGCVARAMRRRAPSCTSRTGPRGGPSPGPGSPRSDRSFTSSSSGPS